MKFVLSAGVLIIVVLFVYFLSGDEAPNVRPFPQQLSDEPDAVMEGFEVVQFDADGTKMYELYAESASYFANAGHTNVSDLSMTVSSREDESWHLTALEGTFDENVVESVLILKGNVAMWAAGQEPSSKSQFETDVLRVLPKEHLAESLSSVTLTTHNSRIHADKVEVSLESRDVRFSSTSPMPVELLLRIDA